jgi:hypothetical protein
MIISTICSMMSLRTVSTAKNLPFCRRHLSDEPPMNSRFANGSDAKGHDLAIGFGQKVDRQMTKRRLMMLNTIRTMALSALVGFGALAAVPATAQADGIYLNFGGHDGHRFGVYSGGRDDGVRRVRRGENWDGDWNRRSFCSPGRALDKAERMGLRRARIVRADRRTVRVAGFKYGTRVTVVFGNDRGCPIVYR